MIGKLWGLRKHHPEHFLWDQSDEGPAAIVLASESRYNQSVHIRLRAKTLMITRSHILERTQTPMPPDHRLHTPLCNLLGCEVPILLAGMGGVARSELVAAVGEAGGYGILGMVRESSDLIAAEIDAVRARTDRPFAVNLIPAATDPALLDAEIAVCVDRAVPAMCFFWDIVPSAVARAKAAGCLVLHQVGSLKAALEAEAAGADVLIVQGIEAGGHVHGTTGALILVEEVVRAVKLPVVASGGFATGASLIAALSLGAQAIHCGTAFLATAESFAHDYHKSRVLAATAEETVYTDAFALNWPANSPVRVVANSVTAALGNQLMGHHPDDLPREVIAEDAGRPLLQYSTDSPLRTTTGKLEAMALFAGQSVSLIDNLPAAAERIALILAQAEAALARLVGKADRTEQQGTHMTMPDDDDISPSGYASPPCLAHEIDPAYFDPLATDPQPPADVARWRKVERERLLAERAVLPVSARQAAANAVTAHLDRYLAARFGSLEGLMISAWWPIKAELDLRRWLAGLTAQGAHAALPLVMERASPMAFRVWTRETRMERGFWNIPVPADGPEVVPDITLSPLVGWDGAGYRLGYGGGYFDRTLAALSPRPLTIGIGLEIARMGTIFPQPHDIPMTSIVTEMGVKELQP